MKERCNSWPETTKRSMSVDSLLYCHYKYLYWAHLSNRGGGQSNSNGNRQVLKKKKTVQCTHSRAFSELLVNNPRRQTSIAMNSSNGLLELCRFQYTVNAVYLLLQSSQALRMAWEGCDSFSRAIPQRPLLSNIALPPPANVIFM